MEREPSTLLGTAARRVVRLLVRHYYHRVEISGAERIPQTGPVLLCANHANSLLDPVLIGVAARRPVRFLAKAPLFETPILGPIMRGLGMIPAFRGSDDASQVRRNLESLDTGAHTLVEGHALGIFPEGKSHDEARVEMIRSGAARMALQAVEEGAKGLQLVPVGINYEDKERFRSSVWIRVGEPIDMDAWLAGHGGDSRKAMRALTPELEKRLKEVVLHLDEPAWRPFLDDLETLVPVRADSVPGKVRPLHQRKRIADAMNYFGAKDRPRADAMAAEIEEYRREVHQAGLRVDSPVLRLRGFSLAAALLRTLLLLFFMPALLGTLFHLVPFLLVRAIASRLQPPGRTTISLYRLTVGLPLYGLWYAGMGWWMFGYFADWFAWTTLLTMPIAGVIALNYWRRAREAAVLWWHEIVSIVRRDRLKELRRRQADLCGRLMEFAKEYSALFPQPAPLAPPVSKAKLAGRALAGLAVAAVIFIAGWFAAPWVLDRPLIAPESGLNLAALSEQQLRSQLSADERSLAAIIRGLDDLEARALEVQADFAAERRSYANLEDNDAVRQLLLSYINYRTALLRILWKYQQHNEVADDSLRLRAFLLDFTSAAVLYESSMKFVHQFNRSPDTVARLNEGEPVWNIPVGFYDSIQRNLAGSENHRLMQLADEYYGGLKGDFEKHGLWEAAPYQTFHHSIDRSKQTVARLEGPLWQQKLAVAAKGLAHLTDRVRYETQSVVSTWIGDVKIREPRPGQTLIRPEQVVFLRTKLKPGDILLERRNWYLSNAFLPGYWPHAAVYVGTADDLKELGLDQDERVRRYWESFTTPDHHGRPNVIIEAVSEGVIFNTIEHSIGGGDSVAVLRPRLPQEEINEAIARAFSHVEKPYDFEFDFTSRDKLVCTEVVFRAYGANAGPLRFPLKNILGRQTMPAIELVRKFVEELEKEDAQLEFVAFIDGDETTGTAVIREDATQFASTLDRPALTFLQGLQAASANPADSTDATGRDARLIAAIAGLFSMGGIAYHLKRRRRKLRATA